MSVCKEVWKKCLFLYNVTYLLYSKLSCGTRVNPLVVWDTKEKMCLYDMVCSVMIKL